MLEVQNKKVIGEEMLETIKVRECISWLKYGNTGVI